MADNDHSDSASEKEFELLMSQSGGGTKPVDLIGKYLPGEDDWPAKSILDPDDPRRAVAVMFMLEYFDDEIGDFREPVESAVMEYLKMRTSVYGASRDEYQAILQGLAGGQSQSNKDGILRRVMSPPGEDE